MPVFWVLVVLGVALLWFLLCFLYKPIGRAAREIWQDSMEEMFDDDENENQEDNLS